MLLEKDGLIVAVSPILSLIAAGLLSPNVKAGLVFGILEGEGHPAWPPSVFGICEIRSESQRRCSQDETRGAAVISD